MKKGTTKPDSQMHARYRKMRVNGKQVNVARYTLEQKLGRPLQKGEYVHHINGNKLDDRPENLELVSPKVHSNLHNHGRKHSSETRAKVSASLIGNQRRKGIPTPPEMREHLRQTSKAARAKRFWSSRRKSD